MSFPFYSVFECTHVDKSRENWVKDVAFYKGDCSIFSPNDPRFCAIEGERKQLEFVGYYEGVFPPKWPMKLTDGRELQKADYYKPE